MSPGTRIGRFEIERLIGRGGMGAVYLARDPLLNRKVAIKTILAEDFDTQDRDELLRSLIDEGRAAANLRHKGIVTVLEAIQVGDQTYIVMEYVAGTKLTDLLKNRQSFQDTLRILREIAEALDYAHNQKLVHRDIKPDNILLVGGEVRIVDFGIAKSLTRHSRMKGDYAGTVPYSSPEQLTDPKNVTGKSDQFSLGVIAYLMLTGKRPFDGANPGSIIQSITASEPLPPSQVEKTVPPAVDRVMRKVLEKDPANRFYTCVDFVDALHKALIDTVPVDFEEKKSASRVPLFAGIALLALAAIGVAWWMFPGSDPNFTLSLLSGVNSISEGEKLPPGASSSGIGDLSAIVTADGGVPVKRKLLVTLLTADGLKIDSEEPHGDASGVKTPLKGTLTSGDYVIRLTVDDVTKKELHFSVQAPPPPPPRKPLWTLAVQVRGQPVEQDGQKFNMKDRALGAIGKGDITATIASDLPVASGAVIKLEWLKDGTPVGDAMAVPADAVGKPLPLPGDPVPGDYAVKLTVGDQSQQRDFTIEKGGIPGSTGSTGSTGSSGSTGATRPPIKIPSLSLKVFSRTNELTQGQQFGYKDPTLGQLDGRELTAHIVAPELPAGSLTLQWLKDNHAESQPIELTADELRSPAGIRYPNPIPLPGKYTVRLLLNGRTAREFPFTITK